jgi:hypothetical protein
MKQTVEIRGAVPVLAMPFDADSAIDETTSARDDFTWRRGAGHLLRHRQRGNPLTDAERAQVWTGRHLNGTVPLVVATTHASAGHHRSRAWPRLQGNCAIVNPRGGQLVALFRGSRAGGVAL